MNDFTGITFNNKHSSQFGIVIVSDGDRYNQSLLPSSQDYTVEIPGGDGEYYFGTNFLPKEFSLSIAFDSVTETQKRQISEWLSPRNGIQKLIFDETPYKYYLAKVNGEPSIGFICFDERGERIYKGEGTINFICYYPYSKSVYKSLNEYGPEYKNKVEWAASSGMKDSLVGYDTYDNVSSKIKLYNCGSIPTDFILSFNKTTSLSIITFSLDEFTESTFTIDFSKAPQEVIDLASGKVEIDTSRERIYLTTTDGVKYTLNNMLTQGSIFKIPPYNGDINMTITSASPLSGVLITYNYLYY